MSDITPVMGASRGPALQGYSAHRLRRAAGSCFDPALQRETTAGLGIAMKRPMAGWANACFLSVLGVLGPATPGLDSTPPRCYKSTHPALERTSLNK